MFIVNGTDYTIIVVGIIGAILFFILQLILCRKGKRKDIKLIPAFLIFAGALFCLALNSGLFGSHSAGAISSEGIAALVFGIIVGIAAVGVAAAWLTYLVICYIQKKNISD